MRVDLKARPHKVSTKVCTGINFTVRPGDASRVRNVLGETFSERSKRQNGETSCYRFADVLSCLIIIITSHGENGSRPQRPLYPRNNHRVHFILHKILYYNTTVSDAMEICFVIIHHVLIDPEFI